MAKELEQTSYKLTKSRISNRNVVHGTEAQLKSTTLAAYNATMNKIIHFSAVLLPSARSRLSPKVFKKIETSPFLFILLFTYVISEEHRSQYSHIHICIFLSRQPPCKSHLKIHRICRATTTRHKYPTRYLKQHRGNTEQCMHFTSRPIAGARALAKLPWQGARAWQKTGAPISTTANPHGMTAPRHPHDA